MRYLKVQKIGIGEKFEGKKVGPSLTEDRGSEPSVKAAVLVVPHHTAIIDQRDLLLESQHVPVLLLRLRIHDLEASLVEDLDG